MFLKNKIIYLSTYLFYFFLAAIASGRKQDYYFFGLTCILSILDDIHSVFWCSILADIHSMRLLGKVNNSWNVFRHVLFQNTITLPPGVQIPPGTVLMRNEQGQLMFVPALQQSASQPTSTPGQRIQYVRVFIM